MAWDYNPPVGVDVPKVTEQQAFTFFVHHLALAAAYFEAMPDDNRNLVRAAAQAYTHDGAVKAIEAFYDALDQHYKEMD